MPAGPIARANTELLILSLPGPCDAAGRTRVRALADSVPADSMIALADAHGMTRLLLARMRAERVPDTNGLYRRLRGVVRHDVAADTRLIAELFRLVRLFEADDIRAVPIKGPVLAVQAYGDPAVRPFRDLDFLVHSDDLSRARDRLLEEGYAWANRVPPTAEWAYIRSGWEYLFVNYDRQTHVDLDTGIAPGHFGFRVAPSEIWARASSVRVEGRTINTLPEELVFLLLSAHGAKHAWNRLVWVADIAGLVSRAGSMDWDRVLSLAEASGGRRMVALAGALASRLAGVDLPEPLARAVRGDSRAVRLADQVATDLSRGAPPWGFVRELRFHLAARERFRDRARYLGALAFTPSYGDWWSFTVPPCFAWLHYIARPFRLLFRAIPRYLRRTGCLRRGDEGGL